MDNKYYWAIGFLGLIAFFLIFFSGSNQQTPQPILSSAANPVVKSADSKMFYNFSYGEESIELARITDDQYRWESTTFLVKGVVKSNLGISTTARVAIIVYDNGGVKIGQNDRLLDLDPHGQTAFDIPIFGIEGYREKGITYWVGFVKG
jgi:hypothetical protein